MSRRPAVCTAICLVLVLLGCQQPESSPPIPSQPVIPPTRPEQLEAAGNHPAIASWLAKKEQIIASGKPYGLVMSGWFTPEEASQIRSANAAATLLAGLSVNFVWDNPDWLAFLVAVAGYGKENPLAIKEDMYLHAPGGGRCAFGWASESWGHEEIYAMDPRNPEWVELITSFYKNVLDQPQHDGIIIDMVLERSLFPDAISDLEWVESTKAIMALIEELNTLNKLVVLNSGRDISEIDAYSEFMDGFLMENFMGEQLGATFEDGLQAAEAGYLVIYAVDTDETGQQDLNKMRLGLTLSLLNDNAWFTYDFGPRDHGQAWWFDEYDVELGEPLGPYYREAETYYREFENGVVVAAPYSSTTVSLPGEHIDVTSGERAMAFQVQAGDGRIYLRAG
jgi:hypothetical protein